MSALLTLSEAIARVLERVRPLESEVVPIREAADRVLAADATAALDLPPFPSSAMDGFAVRAADTPGRLRIAGESVAGRPWAGVLAAGEAVAISTGAVVPDGGSVVPVEATRRSDGTVEVPEVADGAHVRPSGGDVRAGSAVLAAGSRLAAAQLAALAASGITRVRCARRPRVAVLATGSELRRPGEALGPGQIYEANTTLLEAQLDSVGAEVRTLAPVADDPAATEAALADGLEAD